MESVPDPDGAAGARDTSFGGAMLDRPDLEAFRARVAAARAPHDTVIIGCGNLLRSDDAAGPVVIRHLWQRGLDRHARLVDGGTAGMDVGFAMRGMRRVVLVDASSTGATPGTIHRIPGSEIEELPDLREMHSHSFRWDHALAFARWLLKDEYPESVEVWLIEARDTGHGCDMSPPVREGVARLTDLLVEAYGRGESGSDAAADDQASGTPAHDPETETRGP